MNTTCCGKRLTPYRRQYPGWWPSYETGWRCRICGRIRVPTSPDSPPASLAAQDAGYERIRVAGLAFDAALASAHNARSGVPLDADPPA